MSQQIRIAVYSLIFIGVLIGIHRTISPHSSYQPPTLLSKSSSTINNREVINYSGRSDKHNCTPIARILIIGNSLSYNQNMPETLAQIAHELGLCMDVETSLVSGARLFEHWELFDVKGKIRAASWTHVIVQPQGGEVIDGGWRLNHSLRKLETEIVTIGARPLLLAPWAYGPKVLTAAKNPYGLKSFSAAQNRSTRNIHNLKGKFELIPVGALWLRYSTENSNEPKLLSSDHNHASPSGAYLQALLLLKKIFPDAPIDQSVYTPYGATENTGRRMRFFVENL